jgi:chloramphenicol O-acetyltransferase type A
MRCIDLRTWPRREHFHLYSGFDHPHFGLSTNVDWSAFYLEVKQRDFAIAVATR